MIGHPAMQPRLARSDVQQIVRYMAEARDGLRPDPVSHQQAFATGYRAGMDRAVQIVCDMWAAQVIAVDAVNQAVVDGYMTDLDAEDDDGD